MIALVPADIVCCALAEVVSILMSVIERTMCPLPSGSPRDSSSSSSSHRTCVSSLLPHSFPPSSIPHSSPPLILTSLHLSLFSRSLLSLPTPYPLLPFPPISPLTPFFFSSFLVLITPLSSLPQLNLPPSPPSVSSLPYSSPPSLPPSLPLLPSLLPSIPLPPLSIVLEAGYFLNNRAFFENLPTILVYAVVVSLVYHALYTVSIECPSCLEKLSTVP